MSKVDGYIQVGFHPVENEATLTPKGLVTEWKILDEDMRMFFESERSLYEEIILESVGAYLNEQKLTVEDHLVLFFFTYETTKGGTWESPEPEENISIVAHQVLHTSYKEMWRQQLSKKLHYEGFTAKQMSRILDNSVLFEERDGLLYEVAMWMEYYDELFWTLEEDEPVRVLVNGGTRTPIWGKEWLQSLLETAPASNIQPLLESSYPEALLFVCSGQHPRENENQAKALHQFLMKRGICSSQHGERVWMHQDSYLRLLQSCSK